MVIWERVHVPDSGGDVGFTMTQDGDGEFAHIFRNCILEKW